MDDDAPRIPDEDPAAVPSAIQDRGEVVSITRLEALTRYNRDTISDWIKRRGLPVVSGGRHGVQYQINVRTFLDWREAQAKA